jgi:hypothetical protein
MILRWDWVHFAINGSILIPSLTYKRELAIQLGGFLTKDVIKQSEDYSFIFA